MVKIFQIISLLLLLINIQSNNYDNCKGYSSTVDDCNKLLTDEEVQEGYHCCLLTGKGKSDSYQSNQCIELSKEEYEGFNDVLDYYELHYKDLSIDCNSYYLYSSLSFLLLNILFTNEVLS